MSDVALTPANLKTPGHNIRDFYINIFHGFLADYTLTKIKHDFTLSFDWLIQQPDRAQIALGAMQSFKQRQILKPAFVDHAKDTLEQEPLMMSSTQINQLAEWGATIGDHTINHLILKVMPAEQQKQEITQSNQQLESWLGKSVHHFAYSNEVDGKDFDATTVKLITENSFNSAVVINWGIFTAHTSLYLLKRCTPWYSTPKRCHKRLLKNTTGL